MKSKQQARQLSVYEKNQLLKYALQESDLLNKGELPVEYLTGFVEFKNLEIRVNQNVLIPRVETEELVDLLVNFASSMDEIKYLEVGTGSGAISLAFLDFLQREKKLPKTFLVTDFSESALVLARENFTNLFSHEILKKIKFIKSDLLKEVPQEKFNLIVANLPYIPSAEVKKLVPSVKDHEPHLALDGGESGFELINTMLEQILEKKVLAEKSKIFLEVYEKHDKKFIKNNFPRIYKIFDIQEIKDQFERQRFLVFKKF